MVWYIIFIIAVYLFSRSQRTVFGKDLAWSRAFYIGITIWLLYGLRYMTISGDTITYISAFQNKMIQWTGWNDFFLEQREPLFYLLEMICQKISLNYTFYLFATSALLILGFTILLRRYSQEMFLSVLLFCGVGSMYFCMAGLRQAIAMGCTMIAYIFADKRKIIPFLIMCLIAYNFHNSSVVFLFVYFLVKLRPSWIFWVLVTVFVFLGQTRNPIVMQIANFFTSKEYIMDETGLNYSLFFIQIVFIIFCYVYSRVREGEGKQREYDSLLVMAFVGLLFQALTPIKGEFFRVSNYFSVYLCFAVPQALLNMDRLSDRRMAYHVMIVGLLAYIFIFGQARGYRIFFY